MNYITLAIFVIKFFLTISTENEFTLPFSGYSKFIMRQLDALSHSDSLHPRLANPKKAVSLFLPHPRFNSNRTGESCWVRLFQNHWWLNSWKCEIESVCMRLLLRNFTENFWRQWFQEHGHNRTYAMSSFLSSLPRDETVDIIRGIPTQLNPSWQRLHDSVRIFVPRPRRAVSGYGFVLTAPDASLTRSDRII